MSPRRPSTLAYLPNPPHPHHQQHAPSHRVPLPEGRSSWTSHPTSLASHSSQHHYQQPQPQFRTHPSIAVKESHEVGATVKPPINSSPSMRTHRSSHSTATSHLNSSLMSIASSSLNSSVMNSHAVVSPSSSLGALTTPSKSIPIHVPQKSSSGIAMKRSSSELRLLEEEARADLRDYVFYSRLVQGISQRGINSDSQGTEQEREPFGSCPPPRDEQQEQRRRRRCSPWLQRQNELCLSHIIGTRNGWRDGDDPAHHHSAPAGSSMWPDHNHKESNSMSYMDYYHPYSNEASGAPVGPMPSQPSTHEEIFGMDW